MRRAFCACWAATRVRVAWRSRFVSWGGSSGRGVSRIGSQTSNCAGGAYGPAQGEARNALAGAVFIHCLGENCDRTFERRRFRASGLHLVTAAIVLWNKVYLERAKQALHESGTLADAGMLQFLSRLGWERINLTRAYVWRQSRR